MSPDGTQTCNPREQRAADPRLRPRGHWDRHVIYKRTVLKESYCNTTIQSLVKALVILSFQIFFTHKSSNNGKQILWLSSWRHKRRALGGPRVERWNYPLVWSGIWGNVRSIVACKLLKADSWFKWKYQFKLEKRIYLLLQFLCKYTGFLH